MALHLNKFKLPLPKDALSQDWLKNWPCCSEDFFLNLIFLYYCISPRISHEPSFVLQSRMFCAKFNSNWPSGSIGEDFEMLLMYFYYFVIFSTLRLKIFDQKSSLEASAQVN